MASQRERAAHRATMVLAALLAVAVRAATGTSAAGDVELMQAIGTVKSVEADSRKISIITGCGHALRVIVFQADASCKIEVRGVASQLTSLRSGQIVTVRYRSGPEPYVAESIATPPAGDAAEKK